MSENLRFRIILTAPTAGVDFALQSGGGNDYETEQLQRSKGKDLRFEFELSLKDAKSSPPDFGGAFAQGPRGGRFVYLDIGCYAGQKDTQWARRLKVPLYTILKKDVQSAMKKKQAVFEAVVPGVGKDGGPNCATVRDFTGWKLN